MTELATKDPNRKVKEQAIFWLGQTDYERALKFFEEILLKNLIWFIKIYQGLEIEALFALFFLISQGTFQQLSYPLSFSID